MGGRLIYFYLLVKAIHLIRVLDTTTDANNNIIKDAVRRMINPLFRVLK